jgi:hypothetical protein
MNEIITSDLDAKQLADRLTALELYSTSELARLERERNESQEKYATEATEHMLAVNKLANERDEALSQIVQAECRAERFCQERDEARDAIVGWENKWKCAIDMAARAELERDELKYSLKIRAINESLRYSKDRNESDNIISKLNFKL